MRRVKILISGRVVGVFFRAFIEKNANKLNVKGWVRNTNGNVEAVFEGKEEDVDKLIKLCRKGPWAARVDKVYLKEEKYKGEFDNFRIAY